MPEAYYLSLGKSTVWYARGDMAPAVDSRQDLGSFCQRPLRHVKLHGGRANIPLLFQLAQRHERTIDICGPGWLTTDSTPAEQIEEMQRLAAPVSLGGFRPLSAADRIIHSLSVHVATDFFGSAWVSQVRAHPASKAATFLLCPLQPLARFLTAVLDPRFWIDPDHPGRSSRLQAYLGLSFSNIRNFLAGTRPRSAAETRFRQTMGLWYGDGVCPLSPGPRDFPWRIYKHKGGSLRGIMAATRWTVDFLRHVWLDAVSLTHQGRLFAPEYFFQHADEITAYSEHVGSVC